MIDLQPLFLSTFEKIFCMCDNVHLGNELMKHECMWSRWLLSTDFFLKSNPKTVCYLNFIWFLFELWAMKEKKRPLIRCSGWERATGKFGWKSSLFNLADNEKTHIKCSWSTGDWQQETFFLNKTKIPSIFLTIYPIEGYRGAGACPSCHWAKGGLHPRSHSYLWPI